MVSRPREKVFKERRQFYSCQTVDDLSRTRKEKNHFSYNACLESYLLVFRISLTHFLFFCRREVAFAERQRCETSDSLDTFFGREKVSPYLKNHE